MIEAAGAELSLEEDDSSVVSDPSNLADAVESLQLNKSGDDDLHIEAPLTNTARTADERGSLASSQEDHQKSHNEQERASIQERIIFVLCTYCVRMIIIHCPDPPLDLISATSRSVIFVTICRTCNRISALRTANPAGILSQHMIQHTYIYDSACTIAGETTHILVRKSTDFVENIPVGTLAESLPVSARIQGVAPRRRLPSSDGASKDDLILPYLPGGFL
jgi:hypothetical protein